MNNAVCNTLSFAEATTERQTFRFSLRRLLLFMAITGLILAAGRSLNRSGNTIIGPVLPQKLVDQLRAGMHKEEVEAILGPPASKEDHCWWYMPKLNVGWVEVYFNEDGFQYINDESAFPKLYGRASVRSPATVNKSQTQ